MLTTSILFEALKAKHPDAELHYAINSHTYAVVEHNPFIDKFLFVTPEIEQSKIKFLGFLKQIRKENYDVVIDVYGKISSILISYYSKAKLKTTYKKKYTSLVYNQEIKRLKSPVHNSSLAIENRMRLIECLDVPFKPYKPKIYLTDSEIENAKNYLIESGIDLHKTLFMISVLGSSAIKTYPFEYMAKLLEGIVAHHPNSQILFNYIPKQKEEAQAIYDNCSIETQQHIFFNVFGKSLREFLAITSHCNALIGNEGGANNMAKALGIPTFTIFSPYLNKKNWFGEDENNSHVAVHLLDYTDYDILEAKAQPTLFYNKFKPEFIIPKLKTFITNLG